MYCLRKEVEKLKLKSCSGVTVHHSQACAANSLSEALRNMECVVLAIVISLGGDHYYKCAAVNLNIS